MEWPKSDMQFDNNFATVISLEWWHLHSTFQVLNNNFSYGHRIYQIRGTNTVDIPKLRCLVSWERGNKHWVCFKSIPFFGSVSTCLIREYDKRYGQCWFSFWCSLCWVWHVHFKAFLKQKNMTVIFNMPHDHKHEL